MDKTHIASAQVNDVTVLHDVMVKMRDGVELATNIFLPSKNTTPIDAKYPVLLQRTPYNKSDPNRMLECHFFAERGYVVAFQDCRGCHRSGGGFTKYISEGPDGYDTIEWLINQPWSNGQIGTFGLSYSAHTQAATACMNPPGLVCMWLDCGGFSNAFLTGCRNGGAFELRQLTWAYKEALQSPDVTADTVKSKAVKNQNMHDWFHRLPWKQDHSPLKWTPDYEKYLLDIWARENYEEYWDQIGLCVEHHQEQFSDVPQVHLGSWYDPYAKSTTDNFVLLTERKKSPVCLIMGPWTHGGRSLTYSGNIDFGLQSSVEGNLDIDYNHLRLRFFDNHLKDDRPAQHTMPAVTLFVMGGGSGTKNATGRLDHGGYWREENEWPLLRAINTKYFIHESTLTTTIPESGADGITYLYDPNNPVPTIGGNISSGLPIMEPGGFNQIENPEFYGSSKPYLPLSSRPDVLTFQTHILEQAIEVTGPIKSVLWISSEAIDTDFTAKLIDVYPPSVDYPEGYALNITDGIIRTKFRNSWDKPELMHSGELYQVTIELYPTSNLFVKGHRIRLDISSSNFPRLDVNGNTGNNPGLDPVRIPTRNTIYQDKDHPSYIELPIIPT